MALTLYRITATKKLVVVDSATPPSGGVAVTAASTTNLIDTAPWFRTLDTNTPSVWHPAKYFAGAPEILVPVPMTLNLAPICQPYIYTDGTAIDHIVHTDGSCDISFEWSWGTNISFDSATGVNLINNTITSTTPALPTGTAVKYIANTSSALGGLTSKTIYYIIQISIVSTTVVYKLASTYANALAGTAVTITAIGSGIHTLNSGVEGDIDGFIIVTYNSTSATPYTLGTTPLLESSFSVPANRRAFFLYGAPADKYFTFGVYAFRKVDTALATSGLVTSTISTPTLVAENPYQPSTTVSFAGNITGTIDNISATSVSATVAGTAIYRNTGAPTNDPVPTAIAVTVNADGSRDVLLSWTYTQGAIPADGLGIVYVSGTGTVSATDSHQLVSTASTSYLFRGLPQDATYRAGIAAYRTNDTGLHVGPVIQPIAAPDWRVLGGTVNITGNVGGSSSIDINNTVSGTSNFRNASAPTNSPVISSITTSSSTVGTVDITLNWTYTQGALTADEFMLYCNEGTTVPTTSSSVLAIINGSSRSATFFGVAVEKSYKVGITARRKTATGVFETPIVASWVRTGGTANITATINGTPATNITNAVNGTALYIDNSVPTNAPVPTAISIINNGDGSRDIILTWTYTQGLIPADGLGIAYVVGTGAISTTDPHILVSVNTTSYRFQGVPQDVSYRAGIAAYRTNDSGAHIGTIVQPISAPDWRVTGTTANITGNIAGTAAATVLTNITSAAGTATWTGITGTLKAADNATKTLVYNQATVPTTPNEGDVWYVNAALAGYVTGAIYIYKNAAWVRTADATISQIGGSGINILNPRYATFEESTLPPFTTHASGTLSQDTTIKYFGTKSLKIVTTGTGGFWASTTKINNITPNKKWILSCYVYSNTIISAPVLSTAGVHIGITTNTAYYSTNYYDGTTTSTTLTIPALTWTRIYAVLDLTADSNTTCDIRIDSHATGKSVWFDGIMLEAQVGNLITPSVYQEPINFQNTYIGDLDATNGATFGTNITGQITTANVSTYMNIGSLSAITASLGTITAGSLTASAGIDITGVSRFKGANLDSTSSYYPALEISQGTSGGTGLFSNVTLGGGNAIVGKAMVADGSGSGLHGVAAGFGYGAMVEHAVNGSGAALYVNGLMQVTNSTMVSNLNAQYLSGYGIDSFARICGTNSGTSQASGGGFNLVFDATMNGSYRTYSSGNNFVYIGTVSDETIKKDVVPEVLGLDFINRIEPVTFRMKADDNLIHHGFIAQRMTEFFDDVNLDVLYTEANDGIKGINYIALIAPLVKAIQELTIKLNNIEKELQK